MWAICGATEGVAPDFIEAGLLRLALPYGKTRAYLFLVGPGCLATVISGVLDHARPGFTNPWLWIRPSRAGGGARRGHRHRRPELAEGRLEKMPRFAGLSAHHPGAGD